MKGRYPMKHRAIRHAVGTLYLELFRQMAEAIDTDGLTIDGQIMRVAAAVMVGHAEDRPLNASKIAEYTRLPRTTVMRKLVELLGAKIVVRQGHNFLLEPKRALNATSRVAAILFALQAANEEIKSEVSKMDTKPLPLVLPLGYSARLKTTKKG